MEVTPGVRGRSRPTDRVQTDGPAGPQDQPEFLSADRVAADRNRTNVSNNHPPTTRTMNAATTATWLGLAVLDQRGRWIGTVQHVHLNHTTGQPEWITVRVGRWVTTRHIAPLPDPPSSAVVCNCHTTAAPFTEHRKSLIPTRWTSVISSR